VTETALNTDFVEAVNVAVVFPAATVTDAGTVAEVSLLARETLAPPEGAALVSVTVPLEDVPPVTLVGLSVTDESVAAALAGVIVSAAVLLMPW
jgi:hypothetical protein